jgi:hypothetical protein
MDNQFAPKTESYLPAPTFRYSPGQKEIDFAQLLAAGGDIVDSLIRSSIVSAEEAANTPRPTLYSMATKLLNSEAIQERIDYYAILHQASLSVTIERLQQELAANAFSDIAGAYEEDGSPIKNPHLLPRHLRAAIKEYRVDKDGVVHIKLHDKLKAAQMLGDLSGHFNKAHEAKAPKVMVTLGNDPASEAIDVTPAELPDCLA